MGLTLAFFTSEHPVAQITLLDALEANFYFGSVRQFYIGLRSFSKSISSCRSACLNSQKFQTLGARLLAVFLSWNLLPWAGLGYTSHRRYPNRCRRTEVKWHERMRVKNAQLPCRSSGGATPCSLDSSSVASYLIHKLKSNLSAGCKKERIIWWTSNLTWNNILGSVLSQPLISGKIAETRTVQASASSFSSL